MGTHAHRHLVTINDAPGSSQDLLIPPDAGGSFKAAAPLTLEHQCRTWIAPHRNGWTVQCRTLRGTSYQADLCKVGRVSCAVFAASRHLMSRCSEDCSGGRSLQQKLIVMGRHN